MLEKSYEYEAVIQPSDHGGAFVEFPYDIREEFGRGRVKVHATFDGEPYDGSIVNMGVRHADGSVCYIIGIRKDIRAKIGKQPGDTVAVSIRVRDEGHADREDVGSHIAELNAATPPAVRQALADLTLQNQRRILEERDVQVISRQECQARCCY